MNTKNPPFLLLLILSSLIGLTDIQANSTGSYFSGFVSGERFSNLFSNLKQSLTLSSREGKIFVTGLALGSLLPVIALITIARKKLQVPWYTLTMPWNPYYKEKRIPVGKIKYNGHTINAYVIKNEPKDKDSRDEIQKRKLHPVPLLKNTAILFIPGVGDTSRLMVTAVHEKLFPTDHVYVVELEDIEKKRALSTSLGGTDEVLRTLAAVRYLYAQKEYKRIFIIGESRGGAVLARFGEILSRFKNKQDPELASQLGISEAQLGFIIEKLQLGGFWFRAPLESTKATSQFMAKYIWPLLKFGAARILTKYKPSQKEPIDALTHWDNLNIPTLYTPARYDELLGNSSNDQFFDNLKNYNGGDEKNFRHDYSGTHIKTEDDPEYDNKVWNFFLTSNPDKAPQPLTERFD